MKMNHTILERKKRVTHMHPSSDTKSSEFAASFLESLNSNMSISENVLITCKQRDDYNFQQKKNLELKKRLTNDLQGLFNNNEETKPQTFKIRHPKNKSNFTLRQKHPLLDKCVKALNALRHNQRTPKQRAHLASDLMSPIKETTQNSVSLLKRKCEVSNNLSSKIKKSNPNKIGVQENSGTHNLKLKKHKKLHVRENFSDKKEDNRSRKLRKPTVPIDDLNASKLSSSDSECDYEAFIEKENPHSLKNQDKQKCNIGCLSYSESESSDIVVNERKKVKKCKKRHKNITVVQNANMHEEINENVEEPSLSDEEETVKRGSEHLNSNGREKKLKTVSDGNESSSNQKKSENFVNDNSDNRYEINSENNEILKDGINIEAIDKNSKISKLVNVMSRCNVVIKHDENLNTYPTTKQAGAKLDKNSITHIIVKNKTDSLGNDSDLGTEVAQKNIDLDTKDLQGHVADFNTEVQGVTRVKNLNRTSISYVFAQKNLPTVIDISNDNCGEISGSLPNSHIKETSVPNIVRLAASEKLNCEGLLKCSHRHKVSTLQIGNVSERCLEHIKDPCPIPKTMIIENTNTNPAAVDSDESDVEIIEVKQSSQNEQMECNKNIDNSKTVRQNVCSDASKVPCFSTCQSNKIVSNDSDKNTHLASKETVFVPKCKSSNGNFKSMKNDTNVQIGTTLEENDNSCKRIQGSGSVTSNQHKDLEVDEFEILSENIVAKYRVRLLESPKPLEKSIEYTSGVSCPTIHSKSSVQDTVSGSVQNKPGTTDEIKSSTELENCSVEHSTDSAINVESNSELITSNKISEANVQSCGSLRVLTDKESAEIYSHHPSTNSSDQKNKQDMVTCNQSEDLQILKENICTTYKVLVVATEIEKTHLEQSKCTDFNADKVISNFSSQGGTSSEQKRKQQKKEEIHIFESNKIASSVTMCCNKDIPGRTLDLDSMQNNISRERAAIYNLSDKEIINKKVNENHCSEAFETFRTDDCMIVEEKSRQCNEKNVMPDCDTKEKEKPDCSQNRDEMEEKMVEKHSMPLKMVQTDDCSILTEKVVKHVNILRTPEISVSEEKAVESKVRSCGSFSAADTFTESMTASNATLKTKDQNIGMTENMTPRKKINFYGHLNGIPQSDDCMIVEEKLNSHSATDTRQIFDTRNINTVSKLKTSGDIHVNSGLTMVSKSSTCISPSIINKPDRVCRITPLDETINTISSVGAEHETVLRSKKNVSLSFPSNRLIAEQHDRNKNEISPSTFSSGVLNSNTSIQSVENMHQPNLILQPNQNSSILHNNSVRNSPKEILSEASIILQGNVGQKMIRNEVAVKQGMYINANNGNIEFEGTSGEENNASSSDGKHDKISNSVVDRTAAIDICNLIPGDSFALTLCELYREKLQVYERIKNARVHFSGNSEKFEEELLAEIKCLRYAIKKCWSCDSDFQDTENDSSKSHLSLYFKYICAQLAGTGIKASVNEQSSSSGSRSHISLKSAPILHLQSQPSGFINSPNNGHLYRVANANQVVPASENCVNVDVGMKQVTDIEQLPNPFFSHPSCSTVVYDDQGITPSRQLTSFCSEARLLPRAFGRRMHESHYTQAHDGKEVSEFGGGSAS